jgi:hopene-associated glycosyltransferase HpnB
VVAVVPARNEAACIARTLQSLLQQDYPGHFSIIVVDDHSQDKTVAVAQSVSRCISKDHQLKVVSAPSLQAKWSGKLWAVAYGISLVCDIIPGADYLLLTDADIEHDPDSLRRLIIKAKLDQCDLVSLLVLLDQHSYWGRLLIPSFVYFFQKLYPFPWVNNPTHPTAAAAGGCILVRRNVLERAGGIAPICSELIDDCALAALVKGCGGRIWLGLTTELHSLRCNDRLTHIWSMVTRTAYAQLHYSVVLLLFTIIGMIITYIVPPIAVLTLPWHGNILAGAAGTVIWGVMFITYQPTLKLYSQPTMQGLLLPIAGLFYTLMTINSAVQYWRGHGGLWKGRAQHMCLH